jgi:hypothetical protein
MEKKMKAESIDVLFTFDTTGSMYPCLTQVRRNLKQVVEILFDDIPNLRIGFIAHGDYCDAGSTYVTKSLNLTRDINKVIDFVMNAERTGGGDSPECYELVLNQARTEIDWKSGRNKIIVLIGDDVPHGPTERQNYKHIDWRNELGLLLEAGIQVYGVHCMPGIRRHSKPFYEEIAKKTGGFYLTLDQFSSIADLIMGICYKQKSDDEFVDFVKKVEKKGRLTRDLSSSFRTMASGLGVEVAIEVVVGKKKGKKYAYEEDGLRPVDSGRFQTIEVDEEQRIDYFVRDQGLTFQRGRAFYELARYGKKRYKVQQYKEIILMDRESGDFFNGPEVRRILGLHPQTSSGGVTEYLAPKSLDKYKVFIQSTSFTRVLVPGTSLLYEVED